MDRELPVPRRDGIRCRCGEKTAVTTDGRFCKPCLAEVVRGSSPGSVRHGGMGRGADHRAAVDREPSPWGENDVRMLEGD